VISAAISRAATSGATTGLAGRARGRGGEQQRAVGDRLFDRLEQLDMIQNMIGAGGALGADVCQPSRD